MTISMTLCGLGRCGLWGVWREGLGSVKASGPMPHLPLWPPRPKEPHVASLPPSSPYSPQPQFRTHRIHTPRATLPQPPCPWLQVSGSLLTWGNPEGGRSPIGPQEQSLPSNVPAQPHPTQPLAASLLSSRPLTLPAPAEQSPRGPRPSAATSLRTSACLECCSHLVPQRLDFPVQKLPLATPGWVRGSPLGSPTSPALQSSHKSTNLPAPHQASRLRVGPLAWVGAQALDN